jgi:hypothetical protein
VKREVISDISASGHVSGSAINAFSPAAKERGTPAPPDRFGKAGV